MVHKTFPYQVAEVMEFEKEEFEWVLNKRLHET